VLDVLRHFANGSNIEGSAQGAGSFVTGLLGYILARVPFALNIEQLSAGLRDAIRVRFADQPMANMSATIADHTRLSETYIELGPAAFALGFSPNADTFKDKLADKLQPELYRQWSKKQVEHLLTNLDYEHRDRLLAEVPGLLAALSCDFPSTAVDLFSPPNVFIPDIWKNVVPDSLVSALTDPGGIWA